MPIGSILLGLALLFGVGLFITRPLWLPKPSPAEPMTHRDALQAQKAVLLDEIRALDFDHETGKLPDEIYQPRREKLVRETADLLREVDQLGLAGEEPAGIAPAGVTEMLPPLEQNAEIIRPVDENVLSEIEAAVAQLRLSQRQPEPAKTAPAQVPAATVAAGKLAGNVAGPPQASGRFCSQCGNSREAEDKFCAYCGHKF